jgi:hypothetical protein
MNLVPRQGGNRFSGTFFANGANDALQGSNFTDEIKASGLRAPQELLKIWDVNGAIGGPLKRDRLWFFAAARYQGNRKTAPNFVNANANDVTKWTYVPTTEQGRDAGTWKNTNVRLTLQASPRSKFNFFWDEQRVVHAVSELERLGHRGARGALQQPCAAARAAGDVVVAVDEPAAVRGGPGHESDRRLRHPAEHRQLRQHDSGHRGVHRPDAPTTAASPVWPIDRRPRRRSWAPMRRTATCTSWRASASLVSGRNTGRSVTSASRS